MAEICVSMQSDTRFSSKAVLLSGLRFARKTAMPTAAPSSVHPPSASVRASLGRAVAPSPAPLACRQPRSSTARATWTTPTQSAGPPSSLAPAPSARSSATVPRPKAHRPVTAKRAALRGRRDRPAARPLQSPRTDSVPHRCRIRGVHRPPHSRGKRDHSALSARGRHLRERIAFHAKRLSRFSS